MAGLRLLGTLILMAYLGACGMGPSFAAWIDQYSPVYVSLPVEAEAVPAAALSAQTGTLSQSTAEKPMLILEITGREGAPMPGSLPRIPAGSSAQIGPLRYDRPGDYRYTLSVSGQAGGAYHIENYAVTVRVTDRGGRLESSWWAVNSRGEKAQRIRFTPRESEAGTAGYAANYRGSDSARYAQTGGAWSSQGKESWDGKGSVKTGDAADTEGVLGLFALAGTLLTVFMVRRSSAVLS